MDEYGQRPDLPPPRYSMLNGGDPAHGAPQRPPRPPKRYNSSRRGNCCSCLLGCMCFLFLVAVFVAGCIAVFVTLYKPTYPSFHVDSIAVKVLDVNASALTLNSKMAVTVTGYNPNEKIGLRLRRGSRISLVYRQTTLCHGELPRFYLDCGNKTTVEATMEGRRGFDAGLQKLLKADDAAGRVPVTVYMQVPMTTRVSGLDLFGMEIDVIVSTVVGSLSPDSVLDINTEDLLYETNLKF